MRANAGSAAPSAIEMANALKAMIRMIMEILPQYGLFSLGNGSAQEGRLLPRRRPASRFGESKARCTVPAHRLPCDSIVDINSLFPPVQSESINGRSMRFA